MKYRIKQKSDLGNWAFLVPIVGWFGFMLECIFPRPAKYKIQRKYLGCIWITEEIVEGKKKAKAICNKLNGIHTHKMSYVYIEDRIYDKHIDNRSGKPTISRVEFCINCGKILSIKHTTNQNAKESKPYFIHIFEKKCDVCASFVTALKNSGNLKAITVND